MEEGLGEGRKTGRQSPFQLPQGDALPLAQTHLAALPREAGRAGAGLSPGKGLCWSEPGSPGNWMLV